MKEQYTVPKYFLSILNQLFEIEKKVAQISETNSIQRNLNRIKDIFEAEITGVGEVEPTGLVYHNPLGEPYEATRTDCDATIAGENIDQLQIVEVIRPIIRLRKGGTNYILQKAVVVVESQSRP